MTPIASAVRQGSSKLVMLSSVYQRSPSIPKSNIIRIKQSLTSMASRTCSPRAPALSQPFILLIPPPTCHHGQNMPLHHPQSTSVVGIISFYSIFDTRTWVSAQFKYFITSWQGSMTNSCLVIVPAHVLQCQLFLLHHSTSATYLHN